MKRSVLFYSIAISLFAGIGCKNNNLFGDLHHEGSGDAQSNVADGQAALSKSEFAKANEYFTQALAKDSGNSAALYGQAAAQMGLAGLNIGQLVSNLTTGKSGGSGAPFRAALAQASVGVISNTSSDPDSLLNQINVPALDSALSVVIVNLEKIRMGLSDGKIASDDSSILINLGVARLLKAVTKPLSDHILDITETGGTYSVLLLSGFGAGSCPVVHNSAYNVAWGFQDLQSAALKLNLASGSTLTNIKDDLNTLYGDYRGKVVPPCSDSEVPLTLPTTGPVQPSDGI